MGAGGKGFWLAPRELVGVSQDPRLSSPGGGGGALVFSQAPVVPHRQSGGLPGGGRWRQTPWPRGGKEGPVVPSLRALARAEVKQAREPPPGWGGGKQAKDKGQWGQGGGETISGGFGEDALNSLPFCEKQIPTHFVLASPKRGAKGRGQYTEKYPTHK